MKLAKFLALSRDQIEDQDYFKMVKTLYLEAENIPDDVLLNSIAERLSECIALESFIFSQGFIGASGRVQYKILFEALGHIIRLKALDISNNSIGYLNDNNIKGLSDFIAASSLEYINFNSNNLDKLNYNNLAMLFNSVMLCRSLRAVCLSDNNLHSVEEQAKFDLLCDFIKCTTDRLEYVEIKYDNISYPRMNKLNQALQSIGLNNKNTSKQLLFSAPKSNSPLAWLQTLDLPVTRNTNNSTRHM